MTDLSARISRLGGSDLLAVLTCPCCPGRLSTGEVPYQTSWDVWARVTGKVPVGGREETPSQRLGHALEPLIRAEVSRRVGVPFVAPDPAVSGWRVGHADGLAPDAGLEIKVQTGFGHAHPLAWELQCRWYMSLYGAPTWHLVVCHVPASVPCHAFAAPLESCRLESSRFDRDLALERRIIDAAGAWWERHVAGGDEPPRLGARTIRSIPVPPGPVGRAIPLRDDPPDGLADLVERLQGAKARKYAAEMEVEDLTSRVQEVIGSDAGYRLPGWQVTWERGTERRLSIDLLRDRYPDILRECNTERPRSRLNIARRK